MPDHVPAGSPPIVPYLAVADGAKALDFYQSALGATLDTEPMYMPDGALGHATLRVGEALFMVSDAFPDIGVPSPSDLGGTSVSVMLYVPDCDEATDRFVAAGGELEAAPTDQFWGNRDSRVRDPFGHRWNLATLVEQVSDADMAARHDEWASRMAEGDSGH